MIDLFGVEIELYDILFQLWLIGRLLNFIAMIL